MKITKNNILKTFPMRVTCKVVYDEFGFHYGEEDDYCRSELEIYADDIVKREWSKYPNFKGTDYGVVCPLCGSFIVIDTTDIPKYILDNAKDFKE